MRFHLVKGGNYINKHKNKYNFICCYLIQFYYSFLETQLEPYLNSICEVWLRAWILHPNPLSHRGTYCMVDNKEISLNWHQSHKCLFGFAHSCLHIFSINRLIAALSVCVSMWLVVCSAIDKLWDFLLIAFNNEQDKRERLWVVLIDWPQISPFFPSSSLSQSTESFRTPSKHYKNVD